MAGADVEREARPVPVNEVNAAQQRELYGAPLGELCQRVMGALGLTQGRLAGVLGLSAPMLSQLMSAQRVKIGNPAVVHRLQSLLDLSEHAHGLTPDELHDRLAAVRDETATLTQETRRSGGEEALRALRDLASPQELRAAADAVPGTALADLLGRAAQR